MRKIKIQTILYLYIIICPILDCISFLFRNTFNTSISPSTILRPLFIITVCLYIFIKDKKQRKIFILAGITYGVYALAHLYIFSILKNNSSYSGVMHELQYLANYTFMALNLYIYIYTFYKNQDTDKLYKCILTSVSIYCISLYISLMTGTISSTYMLEGMGYKGWFESGNSLSAILVLSMFILFNIFNKKNINFKLKIYTGIILFLTAIYSMILLGTRVSLYGTILSIIIFGIANLLCIIINKKRAQMQLLKLISIFIISIIAIIAIIYIFGSNTLKRREKVEDMASEVVDEVTKEQVHITGDLYEIKNKIEAGTLEEDYMSKEQQEAVLSLNEIATKYELSVEQMRTLQLIYNIELANNQSNLLYRLFGNGYVCQYREMVLEMELAAILINFGLYGFILYLVPFLAVNIYSLYYGVKNIKKIDAEWIMLISGGGLAFALSLLSGYIFFNASTTMIIISINLLLLNKTKEMRRN